MSEFLTKPEDLRERFSGYQRSVFDTPTNGLVTETQNEKPHIRVRSTDHLENMEMGYGFIHHEALLDKGGEPMSDITRKELGEILTALEERLDKAESRRQKMTDREVKAYRRERAARDKLYATQFESMTQRLNSRDDLIDTKLLGLTTSLESVKDSVNSFSSELVKRVDEVKKSNRNTGMAILGIMAGVGATIVLGIWGANSTIVGSASSIFQAGVDKSAADDELKELINDVRAQSKRTEALLETLQNQRSEKNGQ